MSPCLIFSNLNKKNIMFFLENDSDIHSHQIIIFFYSESKPTSQIWANKDA